MKVLALLFNLMIIILTLAALAFQYKREKGLSTFAAFSLGYCLYFGIVPLFIPFADWGRVSSPITDTIQQVKDVNFVIAAVICYAAYLTFLMVYSFAYARTEQKSPKEFGAAETSLGYTESYCLTRNIGIITLVIGGGSFIVIIKALGGLAEAFSMAEVLRSFGTDNGEYINRSILFLRTLIGVLLAAPFSFYIANQYKPGIGIKLLFAASFIMSVLYLIFNAGRLPLVMFFGPFYYAFLKRNFSHPWWLFALTGVITLFGLPLLDNFFFFLSYGFWREEATPMLLDILAEFSFPFINVLNLWGMREVFGYRYGVDYCTWIINIVPTAILSRVGLQKQLASYEFTSQYYDPENISMGGVPTDLVSLGFRQLDVAGVFLQFGIFALLCVWLDRKIDRVSNNENCLVGVFKVIMLFFSYVAYADLDALVRGRSDVIIIIFLIFMIGRYSR